MGFNHEMSEKCGTCIEKEFGKIVFTNDTQCSYSRHDHLSIRKCETILKKSGNKEQTVTLQCRVI